VLTNLVQRPMALLAVRAQVSESPSFATTPAAHDLVGYGVVASGPVTGTTLLAPERTRVQGTNGFAAKQSVIDMDPVGGVRGIPPRGRPV
jgi:hypothetical protein